jgi:hypothetical protein
MDDFSRDHLADQALARIDDAKSGQPASFARHLARIRQRPDGDFEQRAPDGNYYLYEPGGFPYGACEVEGLRARGDTITAENVLVRYP